jgi:hypothetical protein
MCLGLPTSWRIHQTGGRHVGVMSGVACAVLMWRIIVTIGPRPLARAASASSPKVQQTPVEQQLLSRSA